MKRENKYILSVRAKQDIGHIARCTIEKFGVDQSLMYSEELIKTITKLSANPDIGRAYIPTRRKMLKI
ncbi:type II toxin-antitoxin system RelE/ParE family toxin [Membranicola marinus]|uniref:Type II toxin-antitoxin system RelE/ParE family toxin n=2 Tax=Membranihabitans marinus TaxID=1227546 RepID=A0A953HVL5_9BACT|nr:type II toxin-antitoxin system RelE/ParE family toxin [Membranihabitans marinus]